MVRPGQRHAQTRAGRLVHLAEDQRRLVDDAALVHLVPEVVALAAALADAGEHGIAAVLIGDVADQLLDEHRFADARAAEEADLAASGIGAQQVDDLDAGFEQLGRRQDLGKGRRIAVDGQSLFRLHRALAVDRFADDVEHPAQGPLADRHADRIAGIDGLHAAGDAVRGRKRDAAHAALADLLHDLEHDRALRQADVHGVVKLRQLPRGEMNIHDRADDPFDDAFFHGMSSLISG